MVQKLVVPDVSGVFFKADPITGDRTVSTIEATFGMGEALVSGLVSVALYQVRPGTIITEKIASKQVSIDPVPSGGTAARKLASGEQSR